MSGTRALWYDGEAVTTPDLQRVSDAAAVADDLVFEALASMTGVPAGGGAKRVLPLWPEVEGGEPQVLVTPGGTAGKVRMAPALYLVGAGGGLGSGAVSSVPLAARLRATTEPTPLFASAGGSARTDLLYATVQRVVTEHDSRKQKDAAGQVSTQAFDLETQAQVTLQIAQGTTSAPGDSSTAWNFPLAEVALPSTFVEGDPIDAAWITQVWVRAMTPAHTARRAIGAELGTAAAGVITVSQPGQSWRRFGASLVAVVPFKHAGDGAGTATLDGDLASIDWRNRLVRLSLVRATVDGSAYKRPHEVTTRGASISEDSGWIHTGASVGALWTSARGFVVGIDGIGTLTLAKPAGDPPDDGGGDHWILIVEALDRFV